MNFRTAFPGRQQGLSLIGLILISGLVMLAAVLVMKVTPAVIEYFAVVRNVKAISTGADTATVVEVRNAFMKRAQVDDITAVSAADLEISKDGAQIVVSFAYTKKIPMFGPVSLVIDFQGSSAPGGR